MAKTRSEKRIRAAIREDEAERCDVREYFRGFFVICIPVNSSPGCKSSLDLRKWGGGDSENGIWSQFSQRTHFDLDFLEIFFVLILQGIYTLYRAVKIHASSIYP